MTHFNTNNSLWRERTQAFFWFLIVTGVALGIYTVLTFAFPAISIFSISWILPVISISVLLLCVGVYFLLERDERKAAEQKALQTHNPHTNNDNNNHNNIELNKKSSTFSSTYGQPKNVSKEVEQPQTSNNSQGNQVSSNDEEDEEDEEDAKAAEIDCYPGDTPR